MNRLIAQYGLAFVFANVLLEQIGLPIPAAPTLIVAGALAAEGELSAWAIFGVAFVACSIGDALWYVAGRRYGRRVMKLLCRVSLSPDSCVRQTEVRFERWGRLTLVLSKFIPGLSTIAPPLAGAMRLGWPSFLLLNSLGVVIWAGIAIAAGMAFHAQISELILRLEGLGTLAVEIIGALLGGYIALKWWERRRFHKMLRIRPALHSRRADDGHRRSRPAARRVALRSRHRFLLHLPQRSFSGDGRKKIDRARLHPGAPAARGA